MPLAHDGMAAANAASVIRWSTVMRGALQRWCLLALAGCWSDETVNGFTPEQWAALQKQYAEPAPPTICVGDCPKAELGQALFFEPALSSTSQVSCATCHDPVGWFTDTRRDNSVSLGATKWTAHNTISLVNIAVKDAYANHAPFGPYTWTGECQDRDCTTPDDVVTDIALPRAMGSSATIVAKAVRTAPEYRQMYNLAFGESPDAVPDATVLANVVTAFDQYTRQLVSLDSRFDEYIKGEALDESARRGFALFVGKAMCAECHRGPLFTDFNAHVTGVRQSGDHAPATDDGHAATGLFLTPSLRNVAQTSPYMHDGSLRTLADVVDFYRWGGATSGFIGDKDLLIQPLDITDEDAEDLVAFLRSLTGTLVPSNLTADHHTIPTCDSSSANYCGGMCVDLTSDGNNCGSCGRLCASNEACHSSSCCPVCVSGGSCINFVDDPANCGGCGNQCPNNKPNCVGSTCTQ